MAEKTNPIIAESGSAGIIELRKMRLKLPAEGFNLECGRSLKEIEIAYETYGHLNAQKDNAVLILHALTGDAHAAGRHQPEDKKTGWWDFMIGPGKAFDTNRYFILCTNVLGGCQGSTGPSSVNPETGKPYGMAFPMLTIGDMVRAQKMVVEEFGVQQLFSMAGGSMGGMAVLEWMLRFPDSVRSAMIFASTSQLSPQSIAFNEVGRQAIISDPHWQKGDYYDKESRPETGLAIARMIGHITYLSEKSMDKKFGRRLQNREEYGYEFSKEFEVESYLHYQGLRFVQRFDANTYLYITKAMDYYNAAADWGKGSLEKACARIQAKTLVLSFTSDWLFPSRQSKELVKALRQNNSDVSYLEMDSDYGHDAFLISSETLNRVVDSFLDNLYQSGGA